MMLENALAGLILNQALASTIRMLDSCCVAQTNATCLSIRASPQCETNQQNGEHGALQTNKPISKKPCFLGWNNVEI